MATWLGVLRVLCCCAVAVLFGCGGGGGITCAFVQGNRHMSKQQDCSGVVCVLCITWMWV